MAIGWAASGNARRACVCVMLWTMMARTGARFLGWARWERRNELRTTKDIRRQTVAISHSEHVYYYPGLRYHYVVP
ncbi:hypothetical protein VTO73DRAFT_1911 [Trametes versicolor]